MAARGRRARATMHSCNGNILHSLGLREADQLVQSGQAKPGIGRNFYYLAPQSKSFNTPANLTQADMHGVVEHRRRAVNRVRNWPLEHDTRAVTIVAGRGAWIPDAAASSVRAKLRLQESLISRRKTSRQSSVVSR